MIAPYILPYDQNSLHSGSIRLSHIIEKNQVIKNSLTILSISIRARVGLVLMGFYVAPN